MSGRKSPQKRPIWRCAGNARFVSGPKLATHHPVIEPVSELRVGNGIFRCRDGGSRSAFLSCRDSRGDKDELEKARCSRDKCAYHPLSSIPEDWVVEALGHKLETHHPVVEPVSPLSRERKFATAYH